MAGSTVHRKRFIFMFLITALFGVVSWLYFYFSFFNFFTFDESHTIIDAKQKTIYVSSESLSAKIPKRGIKINADKFDFNENKSELSTDSTYQVNFKNQSYTLEVIQHPMVALHIIGFKPDLEDQAMQWELKLPNKKEKTGYGRLIKRHILLNEKDWELRFYKDSLLSRPLEVPIFDSVMTQLNLINEKNDFIKTETQQQKSISLFINGELFGNYMVKLN
jgi:hypothetical protein